ncbi:MFS transporter [Microvirga sp. W0021]|uniref:MFS transporter n=1 Tax=Hohaiivirga grylli TaxID=3133970 RepID=A0ABV0BJP9_9HYPH
MSSDTGLPTGKIRRAVVSAIIGNGLEWYDFLIFGFFLTFITQAYFPTDDAFISSIMGGTTFAIAFFVRPLSGVLIGLYSDKFGRKPALTLMIVLMGLSTLLIGLTPTYAQIGIAAPIIVIIARILQGISVGGEFASATAMLSEYAPKNQKMYYGSFQMCSQAIALALSSGAGYVTAALLSEDSLQSWGWRIPFLLGALVTPIGFYIRKHVDETPEFAAMLNNQKKTEQAPLMEVLVQNTGSLFKGLGSVIIATVSVYVWFVTLPMFIIKTLHLPSSGIMLSNVFCGVILFFITPIAGRLADRYGAVNIWTIGVVLFGALSYPLLSYIIAEPSIQVLLIGQLIGAIAMSMIWGPYPGQMSQFFPTRIRSTGMAISYNLGVLLFGGLAPVITDTLFKLTGSSVVSAYYIIFGAVVSLIFVWVPLIIERSRKN